MRDPKDARQLIEMERDRVFIRIRFLHSIRATLLLPDLMAKIAMIGATHGSSEDSFTLIQQMLTFNTPDNHDSHSHSFQITQHKLDGTNYLDCSQSILMVIREKGRLGYLAGTTVAPVENDRKYASREFDNSMVMDRSINSMEKKIRRNYLSYKTAKEI